jgi:PBP1b-binding outer membrane lipoprotein LpoB
MKKLSSLFLVALMMSSCARNIVVNYSDDTNNTGTLTIQPSRPTGRTFLTVNDNVLVEKKAVRKITVQNLPEGKHRIHLICDSSRFKDKMDEQREVVITKGQVNTQLLETPPYSTGFWVSYGLINTIYLGALTALIIAGDDDE